MTRVALFAALLVAAAAPAPAIAQADSDMRAGATLPVAVNTSEIVRAGRVVGKALIGNPEIADIVPISRTSIYVLGKAVGTTSLTLVDPSGNVITVLDVVVRPDANGVRRQLQEMFPGERVTVRTSADNLVLDGTVSDAMVAQRMTAIANTYSPDKVVNLLSVGSPQQVLLEVRFSEVSRGTVKQLGINSFTWQNSSTAGGVAVPPNLESSPFQAAIAIFQPGITVQLDALEQKGMARTLAQPNLIALSGETANFLAGGEFPVPVGVSSAGAVPTITIEFKQFGVSLAFTPTVLADGLIHMIVAPEVSSLDRDASIRLQGFDIPGLRVRRARTSLELRDGQSFAMAGLIQSDFEDTVRAVPLLGQIPIIGTLFRSTRFRNAETELVIVVTPRIVRPVGPNQLALPTDSTLPPADVDLFLMGRTDRPGPGAPAPRVDGDLGHILR
jgi:pilus assembly protein CpaC